MSLQFAGACLLVGLVLALAQPGAFAASDSDAAAAGASAAPIVESATNASSAVRLRVRSADLDADGDVDLVDYALFLEQVTGPAGSGCLFADDFNRASSVTLGGRWVEAERGGTRENGDVALVSDACVGYALLTAGANPPGHDHDEPMAWMAIEGIDVAAVGGVSLSYAWAGHGNVSGGFDRLWVEWKDCAEPEWPEFAVFADSYPPDGVVVHGIQSHELTDTSRGMFTAVEIADLDVGSASCIDLRFRITASQTGEGAAVDNVRICGAAAR